MTMTALLWYRRDEEELVALATDAGASAVLWTSDVAPYARARDRRVTDALGADGPEAVPHGGTYVVDISRPRTKAGRPFTVFTPFYRHWLAVERRTVHRAPAASVGVDPRAAPPSRPRRPGVGAGRRRGARGLAAECEARAARRGLQQQKFDPADERRRAIERYRAVGA